MAERTRQGNPAVEEISAKKLKTEPVQQAEFEICEMLMQTEV